MTASPAPPSLDSVIALESSVCRLSAEDGSLSYRGYDVRELAEWSTYEETAYLLLHGRLPSRGELADFEARLRAERKPSRRVLRAVRDAPAGADPMTVLREAVSAMALEDPVAVPPSPADALRQGLRLTAQLPVVVAALHRARSGARPLAPRRSLGYGANFLYLLHGTAPEAEAARVFDAALVLRADNELNPSTFAARVTAATGSDVYASVTAGLAALAGPRHGWHTRKVMAMLEEVGTPDRVEEYVRERAARGAKFAGFGHQVYRGEDPRTAQLRGLTESAGRLGGGAEVVAVARALEEAVVRQTGQHAIVDFYLAPLYRALGIPTDLFTAVFAVSRVSGWVAHVLEQYGDDRLLRPRARYVGPVDLRYSSLRQRP